MTFGREFLRVIAGHGDRVALSSDREDITYTGILEQSGNLAASFAALGVREGSRIGLAMQDSSDVLLAIIACWRLSATPVVIDFRAPRLQRASLADAFGLAVIIESLSMPGDEPYPAALYDPDWRRREPTGSAPPAHGSDASPAFLLLSSGTTGTPKAYVQTHAGLLIRIATRKALLDRDRMRFLTPMALTYSATRHQVFGYLLNGGTVRLLPPYFSPSELAEALLAFRASGTALPPAVIARLVKEVGERDAPLFSDLSVLASTGGPARPEDKIGAYHNLSRGYRIGYASSLTGMIAMLAGDDLPARAETSGRIVASARVVILGADGSILPHGDVGAIKAWTPTIAPAVVLPNAEPATDSETMGPDWGIPGDVGFLSDDGFLTIVDRQADMIVRGGVNVAPQELEAILARHPKVVEVAVVGFPDETMGQEIAAFIVNDGGNVEEFVRFVRSNIAPDRRPREIRLVPSLPYNDHGKLVRRRLVEQLLQERSTP